MAFAPIKVRLKPSAHWVTALLVAGSGMLAGCGFLGSDNEGDNKSLGRDGRTEIVGGYFEQWASTGDQVAEVRSDGEFGDDVSDDDIAQSAEAACHALATWPGEAAESLLDQGMVDPELEWLVAPHIAGLDQAELVYFVQSAQAVICPETAERIRLELCDLSTAEIEQGVEC